LNSHPFMVLSTVSRSERYPPVSKDGRVKGMNLSIAE
jgi:hypothetical protein